MSKRKTPAEQHGYSPDTLPSALEDFIYLLGRSTRREILHIWKEVCELHHHDAEAYVESAIEEIRARFSTELREHGYEIDENDRIHPDES